MTNQNSYTDDSAQENTWQIGPRTLPPPAGASDAMRASIAESPQPDPAFMQIVAVDQLVQVDVSGRCDVYWPITSQSTDQVDIEPVDPIRAVGVGSSPDPP